MSKIEPHLTVKHAYVISQFGRKTTQNGKKIERSDENFKEMWQQRNKRGHMDLG
jgi:hypothetical protein